jgi:hypothetical protein
MAVLLLACSLLVVGVIILYLALRFRGPYLLHKLFPGCSVKSVSLRSIRGIRIVHGAHVIEIGRIGLSFGRQPNASGRLAFRCSIQTSNVTCRSFEKEPPGTKPLQLKKPPPPQEVHSLRARRSRFSIQNFAMFANPANDTVAPPLTVVKEIAPSLARNIDSLLRPLFRILFVAAFRMVIRFLPTLMQAIDFELNRATLTLPLANDLTVLVEHVRVSTQVKFSQLEKVIDDSATEDAELSALRRLSRMGNWQLRLRGSWDRTWNRAWGRTHVFSAVSIHVGHIESTFRSDLPMKDTVTVPLPPLVSVFKVDGPCWLKSSVKFIPGRATFEGQSLDLAASLGVLSLDLDNVIASARRVSEALSPKHATQGKFSASKDAILEEPLSPLLSPTTRVLVHNVRSLLVIEAKVTDALRTVSSPFQGTC